MKNIAIITARGKSKRIPRKNIKSFHGKPIISYVIDSAIKSGVFSEIMVSTDDEEIARIAEHYGAKVPFIRSDKTSDDFSTTSDVLNEVLETYRSVNMSFDNLCCIYPTAVFATSEKIKEAYDLFIKRNYFSLLPIVKHSNSVLRSLKMNEGVVSFAYPEYENIRSQDLPLYYYDAGQFYWLNVELFLIEKRIVTSNTGGYEISEMESQDIDNESDWRIAELKYELLQSTK